MSPVLCDYCESSNHDACNCPYRDYVDAPRASVEKKINELTDKMIENMKKRIAKYFHCFSRSREDINLKEPDSSLGSLELEVCLYDDFEPSYLTRPNLSNNMPLPSLEQESDIPTCLSPDLALVAHTSSPMEVTNDIGPTHSPL